jgi:hypothetical protein
MIGEHLRAALRDNFGLVLHVLTAAGEEEQSRDTRQNESSACKGPWFSSLTTDH